MADDIKRMLPVGTILQKGRYKIVSYLKSGGFANTYIVEDCEDGSHYALKEFFIKGTNERREDGLTVTVSNNDNREQYDKQLKKFKKEAARLKNLRHKNIVRVYCDFEENGTHYYVMDFLTGGSLADRLKRKKTYTEAEVRQLLHPILSALDCIHEKEMWHLDLKPGNIMRDRDGAPVLIDFGASKQLNFDSNLSSSSGITYTKGYAPPEQTEQDKDKFGPCTDLYALGATLYNMLTGKTPPSISTIQDKEREAFEFPKDISEQMRDLIVWMMQLSRMKRPQSVQELRNRLGIKVDSAIPVDKNDSGSSTDDSTYEESEGSKTKDKRKSRKVKKWLASKKWWFVGLPIILLLLFLRFYPNHLKEKVKETVEVLDTINSAEIGDSTIIIESNVRIDANDAHDNEKERGIVLCPDGYHPHAIDLGLPSGTKWACCNVGASRPEDHGGYYAWGETEEKTEYEWENYKYYDSSTEGASQNIGSDIGYTSYDVAHTKWGDSWRIPSLDQIEELIEYSDYKWISFNSIYGGRFTGPNGNSIFLPAAGLLLDSKFCAAQGFYWSSTKADDKYNRWVYNLYFQDDKAGISDSDPWCRYSGKSVRPVSAVSLREASHDVKEKVEAAKKLLKRK